METKHTPGPWEARQFVINGHLCAEVLPAVGGYRGEIAYAQDAEHVDGITKAELAANARLIAAAPDYHCACSTPERADDPTTSLDHLDTVLEAVDAHFGAMVEAGACRATLYKALRDVSDFSRKLRAARAKARGESEAQG